MKRKKSPLFLALVLSIGSKTPTFAASEPILTNCNNCSGNVYESEEYECTLCGLGYYCSECNICYVCGEENPVTDTVSGSTSVSVETDATTIDVTVPSELPLVFADDGTVTVPTEWTIRNNTPMGSIYISEITMEGSNNWKLLPDSIDASLLPANSKSIHFSIGKSGSLKGIVPDGNSADTSGTATFSDSDIVIDANASVILSMSVERAAFTEANPSESAYTMNLTFDFVEIAE